MQLLNEENKTPATAEKSPGSDCAIDEKPEAAKVKKSVNWDINLPEKTEKDFMHAADDANL